MYRLNPIIGAAAAAILAAGCATTTANYPAVDQARSRIEAVTSMSGVSRHAPVELNMARDQLQAAERLESDDGERAAIEHHAYMATQYANLAAEKARLANARSEIDAADQRRQSVLLEAREREAEAATAQARAAAVTAQIATADARAARRDAERSRLEAIAAKEKSQQLADELAELEATHTDRGIVLTLDDVLFEFDKAVLQPGSARTLQKVAEFLNNHGERDVRIEGFTDSIGSADYNASLSQQRAEAVRQALLDYGVEASRIESAGYGEQYPVATNDTEAGRQQNRRVEIIIADEGERIAGRNQ